MTQAVWNGGWARQVTQDSFAVADTISGVNMRLTSGGIRECTGTSLQSGPT
jgi:oxalate decarboxylase